MKIRSEGAAQTEEGGTTELKKHENEVILWDPTETTGQFR